MLPGDLAWVSLAAPLVIAGGGVAASWGLTKGQVASLKETVGGKANQADVARLQANLDDLRHDAITRRELDLSLEPLRVELKHLAEGVGSLGSKLDQVLAGLATVTRREE